jgi:hypothetical protein
VGKFKFHRPIDRRRAWQKVFHDTALQELWAKAYQREVIEGLIKHSRSASGLGYECLYWLALLFDRRLFWMHWGRTHHYGRRYWPLMITGTFVAWIRMLRPFQFCPVCHKEFCLFSKWHMGRHASDCWIGNDELPF